MWVFLKKKTGGLCFFVFFFSKKNLKKPSNGGFYQGFLCFFKFFQFSYISFFQGFFMLYPYNVISKQENL